MAKIVELAYQTEKSVVIGNDVNNNEKN